ncbi:MAG TPA: hypothetical protein VFQ25_14700 [Ktedonobacterales bacterium]|nr:hypothetical protein [Ktedonobacterales bacterium]
MPGDYRPGSSGGSWDRRTLKPKGRAGDPMSPPGASGRRPVPPPGRSDPFRPYGAPGASGAQRAVGPYRGAVPPGASGAQRAVGPYRGAGAPGSWRNDPFAASLAGGFQSSAHLEAIQRKRKGSALFHDGNAGHLWRGEVTSLLGESILSVGVVIWLAYMTGSPVVVMLAVLALGLPWLVALPFAPIFERVREPGKPLRWMGSVRVAGALGVLGMHFQTIYPVLFGLLFAIGLAGRLRQSLRVAASRVCLEPGEVELVANDLFTGSAVAAVVGPLLAAALFMALGERVILVTLAAAALFLLASNSDGFLDALPEEQRAFIRATPTTAAPDDATRDDLLAAARGADATDSEAGAGEAALTPDQRERALPEWYQQGPERPFQVIGDIRVGMGLAGGRAASATALLTLAALGLVGGGLSVLEIFYVTDRLGLPGYYLGALAALEAGGLTLGALLANMFRARGAGGALAPLGLTLTGVALTVLGFSPTPVVSYGAALAMGLANGLSVVAARRLLRAGRDGAERRTLSAAEGFVAAAGGAGGAILFTLFYTGFLRVSAGANTLFPGAPIPFIIGGAGAGLALTGVILFISPGLRERAPKDKAAKASAGKGGAPGASGRFASPLGASGKMGAMGETGATGAVGALWGDDADERGAYADEDEYDYGEDAEYDDYDEDDDDWRGPARGRGAPRRGGRPPSEPRGGPRIRRGR